MTILHTLFKPKHSIGELFINTAVKSISHRMVTVEELNDMKTAAIDVKVDIPRFKIRRYRFPNLDLRIHSFDLTPSGVTDTFAVSLRRYKQYFQLAVIAVDFQNNPANLLLITNNAVSYAAVNTLFACLKTDKNIIGG